VNRKLTEMQVGEMLARYERREESVSDIVASYGVAETTLFRWAKRLERTRRHGNDVWGAEAELLYTAGTSTFDIATRVGVDPTAVQKVLKSRGVTLRSNAEAHRRYSLNERFFDNITPESAYWIGFLMADGNVHLDGGTPKVSLRLAAADRGHVEKLRAALSSTHPIRICRPCRSKKGSLSGPSCDWAVRSSHLAASLSCYGVVPRKSATAQVAAELAFNRDFWRGVVDGDGSLGVYRSRRNHYPTVQAVGSELLMAQFVAFITAQVGLAVRSYRDRRSAHLAGVSLCGAPAVKLIRVLYDGCTIALDRKLARARAIIAEHEAQTESRRAA
jgi:hypothetical protein